MFPDFFSASICSFNKASTVASMVWLAIVAAASVTVSAKTVCLLGRHSLSVEALLPNRLYFALEHDQPLPGQRVFITNPAAFATSS